MDRHNQAIDRWVRPEIRALQAYQVPAADGLIKLDAMENPYPWPESMVTRWVDRLRSVSVNRYPDPQARTLKDRLRTVYSIPEDVGIMLGNGSDELIQLLQLAVGGPGRTVLAPDPSFVMYRMIAAITGADYVGVGLRDDFSLDVETAIAEIRDHNPALVFIAYPNNPTANLFDRAAIEGVIASAPGPVVIDEAYQAFARQTFMGHPAMDENLFVMRTLSKIGLAGLRLGILTGPRAWLEQFEKIRLPYNINTLTQVSAEFALSENQVFEDQAEQICRERDRVAQILEKRKELYVFPSATNFLLLRCIACDPERVFEGLLRNRVLIKNLHQPGTALEGCLRVTIGTPVENDTFLGALDSVLESIDG